MSTETQVADKLTGDRQRSAEPARAEQARENSGPKAVARTARLARPRAIAAFPSSGSSPLDKQVRVDKQVREQETREKRRESRRPADGVAQVEFANPRAVKIEGRLMDVSPSGFRMAHSYASLAPGQVVAFSHSEASGSARVMWNRIVDERVETGFLVVAS
jgi:hypothetical protein